MVKKKVLRRDAKPLLLMALDELRQFCPTLRLEGTVVWGGHEYSWTVAFRDKSTEVLLRACADMYDMNAPLRFFIETDEQRVGTKPLAIDQVARILQIIGEDRSKW